MSMDNGTGRLSAEKSTESKSERIGSQMQVLNDVKYRIEEAYNDLCAMRDGTFRYVSDNTDEGRKTRRDLRINSFKRYIKQFDEFSNQERWLPEIEAQAKVWKAEAEKLLAEIEPQQKDLFE